VRTAVLIPCLDEEPTVGRVVADFRRALPDATVWVFDNDSRDATSRVAAEAGATVVRVPRRGKGHVLAQALARVDADAYVLVDGDATYPADRVRDLLAPIEAGLEHHVVGARQAQDPSAAYRPLHGAGNRLVTFLVNRIFRTRLKDVMSGYRAFSREVARNVPVLAGGFDVETEFTLQSLEKGFGVVEIPVAYAARPPGSRSKLSTFRDGFRVLARVVTILKDFRPFAFFGGLALATAALSLLAAWPAIQDYVEHRYVYHVPLAVLAGVLGVVAVVLLGIGTVLATMNARFRELHALARRDRLRAAAGTQSPTKS
jgi:glycosyltransferase involved in cell wall biosynthesis